MRIRLATQDDIGRIAELVVLASEELEEYGTPRVDDAVIAAIVGGIRDGEAVVVAEQEGEVVGFTARVHLPGSDPDCAEGIGRYVLPACRLDHVDRDMQRFAEAHARSRGRKYITGSIMKDNQASLAACLKGGYRVVGYLVRRDLYGQEEGQAEAATATERLLGRGI